MGNEHMDEPSGSRMLWSKNEPACRRGAGEDRTHAEELVLVLRGLPGWARLFW